MIKKAEIGMYVRTKYNGIKKVSGLYSTAIFTDTHNRIEYTDILKASHNIIDLIEEGDYVNDMKVGYVDNLKGYMRQFYYDDENPNDDVGHWEEEIKSIVTKEQFKSMEYNVN